MKVQKKTYREDSDEELMQEIVKGNSRAFTELYDRYNVQMFRYFYKMLWQDREKAEDFMQELFTKIIHKPHLFNPKYRFKTWLYTIAGNMCKNEYRKQKVRKGSKNEIIDDKMYSAEQPSAVDDVDGTMFKKRLKEELDELTFNHRQVFILRFKQGFSIKEISELLDISEGTVKSRIFYTLKKLNERLKEFNPSAVVVALLLLIKLLPI